jgi:hypothetical protein
LRFWFHNGLLRLHPGELTDCLHRFPKCEHNKFNRAVNLASEQVCSAMLASTNMPDGWLKFSLSIAPGANVEPLTVDRRLESG